MKAVRLIGLYGEGGVQADPTVIDRLAMRDEHPEGSGALLQFLQQWADTHQIQG
jgi:hypothetical protein